MNRKGENMNKTSKFKWTVGICVIFVFLLLFLLLKTPSRPFSDVSKIEILQVLQVTENSEKDITDELDTDKLAECLCLLTVHRIGTEVDSFLLADTTYVIHFMYQQKPYSVILGNRSDGKLSRSKGPAKKIYGNAAWNVLLQELSGE